MSPASDSPIHAEALTKDFGRLRAVDGVDLDVAAGEVVGFLGPNGAGKSTTIRMLLGQLRPTAGSATVNGRSPDDPASRIGVGYLPGDLLLDGKRTGWEHLGTLAAVRGGVRRAAIVELCERFDYDPSRKLGDLSRGNRQKLGVVQAFMAEPPVLILDEPTSGLDPLKQAEFAALVDERRNAGAAVLLSSHSLPEVERVADRMAIIRQGRIVERDTLDGLRRSMRQRITFALGGPVPADLDLTAIPGVVEATVAGTDVTVVVGGSIQPVLDELKTVDVVRITSHDDDLDDLFLHLYRDADDTEPGR